jgi:hypothetical protein
MRSEYEARPAVTAPVFFPDYPMRSGGLARFGGGSTHGILRAFFASGINM